MKQTVMLDFETLGLGSNAVLLSLGAVHFCPVTGEIYSKFYAAMDPRTQHGRDIDPSTVVWWLKQDPAARAKITDAVAAADVVEEGFDEDADPAYVDETHAVAAHSIQSVARGFLLWVESIGDDIEVWTNGAVDHAWLESMMTYSGYKNPIKFWNQRDYRTMKALYPQVALERTGQLHNALDDAISQAKHLAAIFDHIGSSIADVPRPIADYRADQAWNAVQNDGAAALAVESAFSADDIAQVINEDNAAQQAQAIGQTKE